MPEVVDVEFGWAAAKCEECDALIIYGHDLRKSSGTMLVQRCVALDHGSYVCHGRMVEGDHSNLHNLFDALTKGYTPKQ